MRGLVVLAVLVLAILVLAAPTSATRARPPNVPIPAQTLNQQHATLQFDGRFLTTWSLGPHESDDRCEIDTRHGSGKQSIHYSTTHNGHPNRANVTIVDSGGNLAFQVATRDRARLGHQSPGFRLGQINQQGAVEDDFTNSPSRDPFGCPPLPDPPEQLQDESGCGGEKVPWDVEVIAAGSKFQVFVSAFPSNDLIAHCPFYGAPDVGSGGGIGSFTHLFESVPLSHVRSVMEKRNGKLIIHGSQRFHSDAPIGGVDLTTTTTATWKVTLIRAR